MEKKTKENIEGVVSLMKDKEIQNQVKEVDTEDPLFSLKNTIYGFFQTRLSKINASSSLKEITQKKLEEKVENDEISIAQLMQLFKDASYVENSSIETLLDVFKPTKEGAVSPLANEVSAGGVTNKISSDIAPDDAEALNMMIAMIKNISSKDKEKSEEE